MSALAGAPGPGSGVGIGPGDNTREDHGSAQSGAQAPSSTQRHQPVVATGGDNGDNKPAIRFRRIGVLGRGSYGLVYLAEDAKGRKVVLKEVNVEVFDKNNNPALGTRAGGVNPGITAALREARLLKDVRHPHIIKVYGAFQAVEHMVTIVMEYAPGADLAMKMADRKSVFGAAIEAVQARERQSQALAATRDSAAGRASSRITDASMSVGETSNTIVPVYTDYPSRLLGTELTVEVLERQKHFSEKRILTWAISLCCALAYLHDHKILHRDIKAANVLLSAESDIKLADFGVARHLDSTADNAKTQCGTPFYLSPELVRNQPYDYKSDMWAVGVLLYELCALQRPFMADNILSLVRLIVGVDPTPISQLPVAGSIYSEGLSNLLQRLLAKDPDARPSVHSALYELRQLDSKAVWPTPGESLQVDPWYDAVKEAFVDAPERFKATHVAQHGVPGNNSAQASEGGHSPLTIDDEPHPSMESPALRKPNSVSGSSDAPNKENMLQADTPYLPAKQEQNIPSIAQSVHSVTEQLSIRNTSTTAPKVSSPNNTRAVRFADEVEVDDEVPNGVTSSSIAASIVSVSPDEPDDIYVDDFEYDDDFSEPPPEQTTSTSMPFDCSLEKKPIPGSTAEPSTIENETKANSNDPFNEPPFSLLPSSSALVKLEDDRAKDANSHHFIYSVDSSDDEGSRGPATASRIRTAPITVAPAAGANNEMGDLKDYKRAKGHKPDSSASVTQKDGIEEHQTAGVSPTTERSPETKERVSSANSITRERNPGRPSSQNPPRITSASSRSKSECALSNENLDAGDADLISAALPICNPDDRPIRPSPDSRRFGHPPPTPSDGSSDRLEPNFMPRSTPNAGTTPFLPTTPRGPEPLHREVERSDASERTPQSRGSYPHAQVQSQPHARPRTSESETRGRSGSAPSDQGGASSNLSVTATPMTQSELRKRKIQKSDANAQAVAESTKEAIAEARRQAFDIKQRSEQSAVSALLSMRGYDGSHDYSVYSSGVAGDPHFDGFSPRTPHSVNPTPRQHSAHSARGYATPSTPYSGSVPNILAGPVQLGSQIAQHYATPRSSNGSSSSRLAMVGAISSFGGVVPHSDALPLTSRSHLDPYLSGIQPSTQTPRRNPTMSGQSQLGGEIFLDTYLASMGQSCATDYGYVPSGGQLHPQHPTHGYTPAYQPQSIVIAGNAEPQRVSVSRSSTRSGRVQTPQSASLYPPYHFQQQQQQLQQQQQPAPSIVHAGQSIVNSSPTAPAGYHSGLQQQYGGQLLPSPNRRQLLVDPEAAAVAPTRPRIRSAGDTSTRSTMQSNTMQQYPFDQRLQAPQPPNQVSSHISPLQLALEQQQAEQRAAAAAGKHYRW